MSDSGDKTPVPGLKARITGCPASSIPSIGNIIKRLALPAAAAAWLFVAVLIAPLSTDACDDACQRQRESCEYEDASYEKPGETRYYAWLDTGGTYCEALSADKAKARSTRDKDADKNFDAMFGAITTCAADKKEQHARACRHTAHKVYDNRIFRNKAPPPQGP